MGAVTAKTPQELRPWSALQLVSADGSPLTIHGSARVMLELEGEEFTVDTVVVSPLTSEAILGLDFLQEQQALIDLASKRLSLRSKRCVIPLTDPALPHARTEVLVCVVRTVEVLPRGVMEVDGRLDAPAGSFGQVPAGRGGLRTRQASIVGFAGTPSVCKCRTGDGVCRHDAGHTGRCGGSRGSGECCQQWRIGSAC